MALTVSLTPCISPYSGTGDRPDEWTKIFVSDRWPEEQVICWIKSLHEMENGADTSMHSH